MKKAMDIAAHTKAIRQEYKAAHDPTKASGFVPYVPPALPFDTQKRMDDYRAIRSLYN